MGLSVHFCCFVAHGEVHGALTELLHLVDEDVSCMRSLMGGEGGGVI